MIGCARKTSKTYNYYCSIINKALNDISSSNTYLEHIFLYSMTIYLLYANG